MTILVVDVAAESGGALSVLTDFHRYLLQNEENLTDVWIFLTSVVELSETEHIRNIRFPEVKKSWGSRLKWEYSVLPNVVKEQGADAVLSLQNNAFPAVHCPQVVYFHNMLLLPGKARFSPMNNEERMLWVYTRVLGPYIRSTWKHANRLIVQGDFVKAAAAPYFKCEPIDVVKPYSRVARPKKAGQITGYVYPTGASSYKCIEDVVEAARYLQEEGLSPEILLTITGEENNYTRRIRAMAEGLPNVRLTGRLKRDDLLELYATHGLLCTSLVESYPIPFQEAMQYGTVIVSYKEPYAVEDLQDSGYNRIRLTDRSPRALADAMKSGLSDTQVGNFTMNADGENWGKVVEDVREAGNNSR